MPPDRLIQKIPRCHPEKLCRLDGREPFGKLFLFVFGRIEWCEITSSKKPFYSFPSSR